VALAISTLVQAISPPPCLQLRLASLAQLAQLARLLLLVAVPLLPAPAQHPSLDRSREPPIMDNEKELHDALEAHRGSGGEPLAGLFNLTRRMEDEQEEQFDVDLTIMDFLAYKATDLIFEWRASSNPHQSDLPSALVTMTAGRWQRTHGFVCRLTRACRMEDLPETQAQRASSQPPSRVSLAPAPVLLAVHAPPEP
jgi:hypothetical protein